MLLDHIYNMDFREGVYKLSSKVDMVMTSPPYLNYRTYGRGKLFSSELSWYNFCFNTIKMLADDIVKPDGVIWWNTATGYKDFKAYPYIYMLVSDLFMEGIYLIDDIPWIKKSCPPKKFTNRPYSAWTHNFIFSKQPDKVTYYVDNVRTPYAEATLQRMKYSVANLQGTNAGEFQGVKRVKPNPLGASPPNYLILKQDTSKRPHPAPMVPDLANWAIRAYTKEEDTVLDPMCGVGTTLVEARRLKRHFVGFDINNKYIKLALKSMERLEKGIDPYNGLKETINE